MHAKKMTLVEEIDALEGRAEAALAELAEKWRPTSIPAAWMRANWMAKAGGNVFSAYKIASKETDVPARK